MHIGREAMLLIPFYFGNWDELLRWDVKLGEGGGDGSLYRETEMTYYLIYKSNSLLRSLLFRRSSLPKHAL